MPAINNKKQFRKTRRVETSNSDQLSSLRPSTRVSKQSDAGSSALALAEALGVGAQLSGELGERRNKEQQIQAEADFQTGTVDPERLEKYKAYNRTITQLRARSNWATDKADIDEFLRSQDTDNMTPEELHATIDEQFKIRFDGLDDEDEAEVLIPRLNEYRENKVAEYLDRQKELVDTRNQADLTNVAEDVYQTAAAEARATDPYATVPFDYKGLHAQIRGGLQYSGKESNEIYFKIISDIAIRNGDPDILKNLPDRWEDGTPTFKNIPSYNERLLNSENRAEAVRSSNDNKEAKILKAQRDEYANQAKDELYLMSLDGTDPSAFAESMVRAGVIEGKEANQIVSAYRSSRDDIRKQSVDFAGVSKLRALIQTVPDSFEPIDIYQAWADGTFGNPNSPESGALFKATLADLTNAKQTRSKVLSLPNVVTFRNQFKALNKPAPNIATGQVDETLNSIYANNLGAMERELAANPDGAAGIYQEYAEKTQAQIEGYKKSRYVNNISTPEDLITGLTTNRITIEEFVSKQSAIGLTDAALANMRYKEKTISDKLYRQIKQYQLTQL